MVARGGIPILLRLLYKYSSRLLDQKLYMQLYFLYNEGLTDGISLLVVPV